MLLRCLFALLLISSTSPLFAVAEEVYIADDEESGAFAFPVLDESTLGVICAKDSNAYAAFSKTRKKWSTYTFAKHLLVSPVTLGESPVILGGVSVGGESNLIVGFNYAHGPIDEFVAIDCQGRFRKHQLKTPLHREMNPILIGHAVLYYIADETVYAFSGKTGTWDTLEVPGLPDVQWNEDGSGIQPGIHEHGFDSESIHGIMVKTARGVMKFVPEVGAWQLMDESDVPSHLARLD